jgi:hypothetical protein
MLIFRTVWVALVTTFRIVGAALMTTLRLSCGPFEFCLNATRAREGILSPRRASQADLS